MSTDEYILEDKVLAFTAKPQSRWLDMATVFNHANALLEVTNHPQRLYVIAHMLSQYR